MSRAQSCDKIRNDVIVGAGDETQWDRLIIEGLLELCDGLSDPWSRVLVEARKNMRRAGDNLDAIGDEGASHGQRDAEVSGSVIEPRKDMTVKINH